MITSRNPIDLVPEVRIRADAMMMYADLDPWLSGNGIKLIYTCTYRDGQAQDALYAQGRTKPGRIVTNARAGHSAHQFRRAFDIVPLRHGKPVWGTNGDGIDDDPTDDETDDIEVWMRVGELGERCGLEWAGRWQRFREFPHFQYLAGKTVEWYRTQGGLTPVKP